MRLAAPAHLVDVNWLAELDEVATDAAAVRVGSLVHADPAAELPAVLVLLGGDDGAGRRRRRRAAPGGRGRLLRRAARVGPAPGGAGHRETLLTLMQSLDLSGWTPSPHPLDPTYEILTAVDELPDEWLQARVGGQRSATTPTFEDIEAGTPAEIVRTHDVTTAT